MLRMQIIGNLGQDCRINTVNGKNVINFSVAHTEQWKDAKGEKQQRTTWVDCAYWTDNTAVSQYLTKGRQVWVDGQPEAKTFTKGDQSTGVSLSCRVFSVQLLGGTQQQSGNGTTAAPVANAAGSGNADAAAPAENLPF